MRAMIRFRCGRNDVGPTSALHRSPNRRAEEVNALAFFEGTPYNVIMFLITVLAVIVAIFGVIYARQAVRARGRLAITLFEPSPLLSEGSESVDGLRVSIHGSNVTHPFMMSVHFKNVGAADIAPEAFVKDQALSLDFGVPVLTATPQNSDYSVVGSLLQFGPTLLAKGASRNIQILLDGKPDLTDVRTHLRNSWTLKDIDPDLSEGKSVTQADNGSSERRVLRRKSVVRVLVALVLALAATGVYTFLSTPWTGLSRHTVVAGRTVAYHGVRFASGDKVGIWLCFPTSSTSEICTRELAETKAGPHGGISGQFTVPSTILPGSYKVSFSSSRTDSDEQLTVLPR